MTELERMLTHIGDELDWPATPDLAPAVTGRLRQPARPRRPIVLRRSLALAFALLLLAAGTVFAAVPGVRDAVLDFFGLQGATVERRAQLPTPPPERPLDLGRRMTLSDATDRVGFAPLVPAALGEPDGVYLRRGLPGGELSLAYTARPGLPRARSTRLGLLVTEFRGDLSPDYVGKLAGLSSTVERLQVDGRPAIWVAGAPHFFFYRGPNGEFVDTTLRIAGNVLLLERGRLLVRLEGAFGRDRAIELARSLR